MATYTMRCPRCGDTDTTAPITAGPPSDCPKCGGDARHVLAPTPVVFRGTGWAGKDHRRTR